MAAIAMPPHEPIRRHQHPSSGHP